MRRAMVDPDKPMGKMIRIKDFLPPPSQLVVPKETKKVTISLNKSSVDFFKQRAKQYHTKYQRMIRELVDRYVMQYSKA